MPISDARLEKLSELGTRSAKLINIRDDLNKVVREIVALKAKRDQLQTELTAERTAIEQALGNI